jgi:hypothetical protein
MVGAKGPQELLYSGIHSPQGLLYSGIHRPQGVSYGRTRRSLSPILYGCQMPSSPVL